MVQDDGIPKILDIIEEDYTETVLDLVDLICSKDEMLYILMEDNKQTYKSGYAPDRINSYNRVIQRRTEILKQYIEKLKGELNG